MSKEIIWQSLAMTLVLLAAPPFCLPGTIILFKVGVRYLGSVAYVIYPVIVFLASYAIVRNENR